eukprot:COSAG05_NODE_3708_length_1891_cov_2.995477_1_plen_77_part_00
MRATILPLAFVMPRSRSGVERLRVERRVPNGRRRQGGDERDDPQIKWTPSASTTNGARQLSLLRGIIAYRYAWQTS